MATNKIIGITQKVKLPGYSSGFITAKIDTGAHDSSIWASSIVENDGTLSFILFGPDSPYYTGQVIETNKYSNILIRNSFGHEENRYKVGLKIKIANIVYNTSFNLADRSKNNYAILIGKQFLKSRFLVDVAKKNAVIRSKKVVDSPILVLTSRTDSLTKDFFNEVSKTSKSDIILERYKKLNYEIDVNGCPYIILPDGRDLADIGLVYFKAYSLYMEHAMAIVSYLRANKVPFMDKELTGGVSRSKLSELFALACNKVSVPQTKIVTGIKNLPDYESLSKIFGDKIVIKDAFGDRGKNNFLVVDSDSYIKAIDRLKDVNVFIIQRFIENDGFLRILLMGGEVVQIVSRSSVAHKNPLKSHLNKPHGGANAVELDVVGFDTDVIAIVRHAAAVMRRNVAGVDIVQDKNSKKWYVLEVNYNPEVVSGIYAPKRAAWLAELLDSMKRGK
ncbi:MAG: RimK/LysX family protein [Candidatus Saccharibacteria bacterium]